MRGKKFVREMPTKTQSYVCLWCIVYVDQTSRWKNSNSNPKKLSTSSDICWELLKASLNELNEKKKLNPLNQNETEKYSNHSNPILITLFNLWIHFCDRELNRVREKWLMIKNCIGDRLSFVLIKFDYRLLTTAWLNILLFFKLNRMFRMNTKLP